MEEFGIKFRRVKDETPLGPFDAQTAAYWNRELWVSSLNMNYIPPLSLGPRDVYLREDGRFGSEDHTVQPQAFLPLAPHLMCIARSPRNCQEYYTLDWPLDLAYERPEESGNEKGAWGEITALIRACTVYDLQRNVFRGIPYFSAYTPHTASQSSLLCG